MMSQPPYKKWVLTLNSLLMLLPMSLLDENGVIMAREPGDENRFLYNRYDDHLVTPFQCDQRHFVNLFGRHPLSGLVSDIRALKCIWHAILDAFWSREPSPVNRMLREEKRGLAIARALEFAIAIVMLQCFLDKGIHDKTIQFETVGKFCAAASHIFMH